MKLKKVVAISLIICAIMAIALLFTGLVFGSNTLDRWSSRKASTSTRNTDASLPGQSNNPSVPGLTASGSQSQNNTSTSPTNSTTTSGGSSASNSTGTNAPKASSSSGGATTSTTTGGSSSSGGTTVASASISTFSASPSSISYNSASTLSWASSNASSCSLSSGLGAVATSGTKSTGNLTSTTTYTLTCGTATKQTTVTVAAAPPSCGQSGGSCTSAQVATHNSQGNCWVIYNGYYYIVTSYTSNHPGGQSVFNSTTCGHDITAYMNGSSSTAGQRHGHSGGAYNTLNSYRIGPVQG